ncbi:MAG TPA: alkaline phosphatase family protein [Candidatus Baltobacteraceae bacterium]|nr:alkaline phosphatase family protein [Candidatus Baltobacteraceae bacterium]
MRLILLPAILAVLVGAGPGSPSSPLQSSIQQRVRYVFVIYQENRSFDHYFGTFPGANGVYSPDARKHGFKQFNPVAQRDTQAFRIATSQVGVLSNARKLFDAAINNGAMDGFVTQEAALATNLSPDARKKLGMTDSSQAASVGDESMAHVDCDTIPYLWNYASRFALFDSFFQGARGPSTPSNVEIIAAQNGETEYERYGSLGPPYTEDPPSAGGRGVPIWVDLDPAWGPYNSEDFSAEHQVDQTYATVMLNLEGAQAGELANNTQDIVNDIAFLRGKAQAPVNWTWYEQGYANPADPGRVTLVTHHLAPHYFGYIANNPTMDRHIADITQFQSDIEGDKLGDGGLFYLKGGFGSNLGLKPAGAAPNTFTGDDDHPGESDMQIAQADVAALVNLIARSKYWSQSAIVITWDDPGGFWDHVPPPSWLVCPDSYPCGNGQRVPMLLVSPYARNAVVHDDNDQASVVKFVNQLFDRTPLAQLPDEARYMPFGPHDGSDNNGDLSGGFDPARLSGKKPPIPAEQAIIPDDVVRAIPSPWSCKSIGVTPVAPPAGISDAPPPGFNPRVLVVPLPSNKMIGD